MMRKIRVRVTIVLVVTVILTAMTCYMEYVSKSNVKIACVGDSITYGSGVEEREENSYPQVLGQLMGRGYQVRNFGVSGRTAMWYSNKPYVKEKMYSWSLDFAPDIVIIMFGTNDSKAYNWQGEVEFKEQYKKMIDTYRNLPTNPEIYLCTPATAYYVDGQTEGAMNYNIDGELVNREIVPAVREIAEELNLKIIDIHSLTAGHAEWFSADGIHPDKNGARAIAEEVYRVLVE